MKQEGLKERVELLEAGEKLGYPRLGYGRSTKIPHDKRIPAGQEGWEKFCAHAHIRRVLPALRIARVLRDNNVTPYHPLSGAEVKEVMPNGSAGSQPEHRTRPDDMTAGAPAAPTPALDLLDDVLPPAEPIVSLPRPKKGGHKKPPHPGSKRARRG